MNRPFLTALLLTAAACPGCTLFVSVPPLEPLPKTKVVLKDVRCVPQEADWDCGPACLTTVMRYRGSDLTLKQVKAQLKRAKSGGTLFVEMIYGARKNGFTATWYRDGSINDLRRKLLAGKPLILMLHPMPDVVRHIGRRAHYVVAVGYDDDRREAILHSGRKAFAAMSYRRLQLEWSRTNFLTLMIEK